MKVLLIEDEKALSESLCQILKKHNISAEPAYDGESGLYNALTGLYDVIVLDIMLPGLDGFEILEHMRRDGVNTPVLMLSARGETHDKVHGLNTGADDYMSKPFSSEELVARINALSRRNGPAPSGDVLKYGDLELNLTTMELKSPSGQIKLSLKEYELMRSLMAGGDDNIAHKEDLIVRIWGRDAKEEYDNLDVYITFLKKKLLQIRSHVNISTVRSVGYKLGS